MFLFYNHHHEVLDESYSNTHKHKIYLPKLFFNT